MSFLVRSLIWATAGPVAMSHTAIWASEAPECTTIVTDSAEVIVGQERLCATSADDASADAVTASDSVLVGDTTTRAIPTNLNGFTVPGTIGPVYVGNTADSADAITLDSGRNFPPGVAFRRYLGEPGSPQQVTAGTQLGYLDFRGYSEGFFYNAGSLDMVVDPLVPYSSGLMPTKMRFAVSDGQRVYIPMELTSSGRLELGAIQPDGYYGAGILGDPRLYVYQTSERWNTILSSAAEGGTGYVLRLHSGGTTGNDYLLGASSGAGAGAFMFSVRGNGDTYVEGRLLIQNRNILDEIDQIAEGLAVVPNEFAYFAANGEGGDRAMAAANAVAVGASANAGGSGALAFGTRAFATGGQATAIGNETIATGVNALAVGNGSRANGVASAAFGDSAIASSESSLASGARAQATAINATATGASAKAIRSGATALGSSALAQGAQATAIGSTAIVTADLATALGAGASATHANSTAIGAGARTTTANQVMIGTSQTATVVAGIDASTDAQVGPVDVVTVDANGTIGRQRVATAQDVSIATAYIAAVSDSQFESLSNSVSTLGAQVSDLSFRIDDLDRSTSGGIATAIAMGGTMIVPDSTFSLSLNASTYRGEQGFAGALSARVAEKVYVSGAVAGSTVKRSTGGRVGMAIGF